MIGPRQWTQTVRFGHMVLDLAVLSTAYIFAFLLRFEGALPADILAPLVYSWPCVLLVQYVCLMGWRVPELAWQYVSLLDVRRIGTALSVAAALFLVIIGAADLVNELSMVSADMPPRGVILLDMLLGLLGLVGMRVAVRVSFERSRSHKRQGGIATARVPTLLVGAGSAGAEAAKQIAAAPHLGIQPVGFLDDDRKKHGLVIHGIRVLGTVAETAHIARLYRAQQALITIGEPSGDNLRRIVDMCRNSGLLTKVIPDIRHILEGKINLAAIREVAIEDLLRREPVHLDLEAIAAFVNGRKIMITGAGGSIGSELCRLVCRYGPASVVLVEHTENNLFHIHRELGSHPSGPLIVPCLADVCDAVRMRQIFATHRPEMVLHAAAYKHVPMIEWNPGEAIKNNVQGTRTLADLADLYEVGEFVMISTDKAVNPSSIMGASKRIAEIYIQALSQHSRTRFVAVRFGNVLGSAGSVIPTFKEQIARGGPVTVTHPDMQRFFMTIPEACQLVLQAATMGRGGEIFILDMGNPVKIVDLARNLIALSGLRPDEIEISYTGMRPGEKLFEELALKEETADKTHHPKIFIGRLQAADWDSVSRQVQALLGVADCPEPAVLLRKLKEMVPEFMGAIAPEAPAAFIRTDAGHIAGLNGNGKAANGTVKKKRSGVLDALKPKPIPSIS